MDESAICGKIARQQEISRGKADYPFEQLYICTLEEKTLKNVKTDLGLPKKYGKKKISAMSSGYWMGIS